jgi:hypothetical protein
MSDDRCKGDLSGVIRMHFGALGRHARKKYQDRY